MKTKYKHLLFVLFLLLMLIISIILAFSVGYVKMNISEIINGFTSKNQSVEGRILYYARLPRILAAIIAGAGLAVSGVLIQTVLSNPLASPGIIGVNSGAGLAVTFCMALFPEYVLAIPVAAFIGAFITVITVCSIAKNAGASKLTIILSGIAVSSLLNAGISTFATFYPEIMSGLRDFQNGGLSGVTFEILKPTGLMVFVGIIIVLFLSEELDILGLGEKNALSLGLNVSFYRFLFLIIAAVLAGAAVSFAGLIGFIGLIVPHMTKFLLKGCSKRIWIFSSVMTGSTFLLICDTVARTAFSPYEIPVGIIIAYIGVPFFIWLVFRERRRRHD